jgi:hypothetical protein
MNECLILWELLTFCDADEYKPYHWTNFKILKWLGFLNLQIWPVNWLDHDMIRPCLLLVPFKKYTPLSYAWSWVWTWRVTQVQICSENLKHTGFPIVAFCRYTSFKYEWSWRLTRCQIMCSVNLKGIMGLSFEICVSLTSTCQPRGYIWLQLWYGYDWLLISVPWVFLLPFCYGIYVPNLIKSVKILFK